MVLSDVEIRAELADGSLVIEPGLPSKRITPSSIDLLLYERLLVLPEPGSTTVQGLTVDPDEVKVTSFLGTQATEHDLAITPYTMEPGAFLIGQTHEKIELPTHLSARVEGKSTLGRLGLAVHITAPTVHAGFKGRLTLEMRNLGPFALTIKKGMEICQLVVERLGIPSSEPYGGQFQGQK